MLIELGKYNNRVSIILNNKAWQPGRVPATLQGMIASVYVCRQRINVTTIMHAACKKFRVRAGLWVIYTRMTSPFHTSSMHRMLKLLF